MTYTIGLIHATMNSIKPINDAFHKFAPEEKVLNFLDDGLDYAVERAGEVTPKTLRRFIDLLSKAEESGVDGILFCCSIFTPHVKQVAQLFSLPIKSVDLSMISKAVHSGKEIGLIATNKAAGPISTKLLYDTATEMKKEINVQTRTIPEAFEALQKGNVDLHDELVNKTIIDLSLKCDVIVLAQLSMTRALGSLRGITVPILTSPEISVKSIIAEIEKYKAEGRDLT